jgi:multiple sugar transport system ATP-binding protein
MVEVTELMGNEIFLYLIYGNTKFVARVDPRSDFKVGEKIKLVFNMANMHLFDPSENAENPPAIQ